MNWNGRTLLGMTAGSEAISYTYDADGQRTGKKVGTQGYELSLIHISIFEGDNDEYCFSILDENCIRIEQDCYTVQAGDLFKRMQ